MLHAVGVSRAGERVYRFVLRTPRSTAGEIASGIEADEATVREALAELTQLALVSREGTRVSRYSATAPEIAFGALVLEQQDDLLRRQRAIESVRAAAANLQREYLSALQAKNPHEVVEIVLGRAETARRALHLKSVATQEVRAFCLAPSVAGSLRTPPKEPDFLPSGVRSRAIYERGYLEAPGAWERLVTYAAHGEEARVVSTLPVRLLIVDRDAALVPLVSGHRSDRSLVVRPSALLEALVALFEQTWRLAHPVATGDAAPAASTASLDRRILEMLAAGSKDETISRQLGISITTVRRHVAQLLDSLDARTRFQAGVTAAHRGLL